MKKTLLIFVFIIFLCGCNNANENKFSNYEHYDLSGKNLIKYNFVDKNNIMQNYAIADITPDSYEISVYGLFYQVSENDYILLDKIQSNKSKEDIIRFQYNKLYVIGMGETPGNYEYILNQEKITKKELIFEFSKGFIIRSIKDVKDNEIYYYALINEDSSNNNINVELICSLSTYKCELND
ncbi:MAG TPA: hypothetical protein IAC20_05695 [Candidatus Faecisoma merdavium]|nr:hypothetical protein [Candidatus Faecisoma merdavium]